MSQPPKKKTDGLLNSANSYIRYSSLGIQMGIAIGLGAWLGVWLDGKWQTGSIFTIIGALLGLFLALYRLIKEVLLEPNNKDNEEE